MESLQLKVKYNYFCQISNIVLIALKLDTRAIKQFEQAHTQSLRLSDQHMWVAGSWVGCWVMGWWTRENFN